MKKNFGWFCLILVLVILLGGHGKSVQAGPLEPPRPVYIQGNTQSVLPGNDANVIHQIDGPQVDWGPWDLAVFQSYRDGNWEVYTSQFGTKRLTNHSSADYEPRCNTTCTQIVFTSNRTGTKEIYRINGDGTGLAQLTFNSNSSGPTWSPDGTRILFQRGNPNNEAVWEIYRMNVDGSGVTRLTNNSAYDGMPAWSPDGNKLAFISKRTGGYRVWVMNADGGNPVQLSTQPYCAYPVWNPDGIAIGYSADADDPGSSSYGWWDLWIMNADGSGQRSLMSAGSSHDAIANGFSPLGNYLGYTYNTYTYYQGNYYLTTLNAYTLDFGFGASALLPISQTSLEGYADWKSLDPWKPVSEVQKLPAISPYTFTLNWSGYDVGPSCLKIYDVSYRDGVSGDWHRLAYTTQTSGQFSGIGGHTYYFAMQALDNAGNWEKLPADYDTYTTIESFPPYAAFLPIPAYSHSGAIVQWKGTDPGGSGINNYSVRYKQGVGGSWIDWLNFTQVTAANFSGTPGETYFFQVSAIDRAGNIGGWSSETAASSTTIYSWKVEGTAYDNTDTPVISVTVVTTPPAFSQEHRQDGYYATYLASPGSDVTVDWAKAGYGALPDTILSSSSDVRLDLVMPPMDNLIGNWGFESGSTESWMVSGPVTPIVVSDTRHTGQYAIQLGEPLLPDYKLPVNPSASLSDPALPGASLAPLAGDYRLSQAVTVPVSMTAPILSFMYNLESGQVVEDSWFEVSLHSGITDTVLLTTTQKTAAWQHAWFDVSAWSGKSITLTFEIHQNAGNNNLVGYVDEITLGSGHPDIWVDVDGSQAALPGKLVNMTLIYGNRGGAPASVGVITATLPAELEFMNASVTPTISGTLLTWNVSDLPVDSGPFTIQVTAKISPVAAPGSLLATWFDFITGATELELTNNHVGWTIFVGQRIELPLFLRY